jgi:outer membrane protein assembly factor BamB
MIGATNGFTTDNHELLIAKNGHYFFIAKYGYTFDMSTLVNGGKKNATILTDAIMEYDESGNEVMEWRMQDHFKVTDATHEDLTAATIDYSHTNAIDLDLDGMLVISNRNMDEITKIDPATGDILWRMGGKNNEFTFIGDSLGGFSHQHCVRVLPNGHFLLFDNGNYHSLSFSRAVEYVLDQDKKTATLVWQYRHTPDRYAFAMGSVQRLPNGNTLIGWGANTQTTATEVTPDGKVALEIKMDGESYRVFKFPWQTPTPQADVKQNNGSSFALSNYPNPATSSTTFSYTLPNDASASLKITDCLGRVISAVPLGAQEKGDHSYTLGLSRFTRGVYLCSLEAGGIKSVTRLIVD